MAAAGIAVPQRFFDMLHGLGLAFEALPLPDHHAFDIAPWPGTCNDVLVTEKDAVKLSPQLDGGSTRVWVVALDSALPDDLVVALASILRAARPE
jgi:tetraacyldisaccharide 4'-kinase